MQTQNVRTPEEELIRITAQTAVRALRRLFFIFLAANYLIKRHTALMRSESAQAAHIALHGTVKIEQPQRKTRTAKVPAGSKVGA